MLLAAASLGMKVAAARREAASRASATEAAVQQAREAAAREHAVLAAKVAAAEQAAAAARQEAERLRQRRVQELEELQGRFAGLLQVGKAGVAVVAGCEMHRLLEGMVLQVSCGSTQPHYLMVMPRAADLHADQGPHHCGTDPRAGGAACGSGVSASN